MDHFLKDSSLLLPHPQSILLNRSGYFPNISQQQYAAYVDLKQKLEDNSITFDNDDGENSTFKLLRFLRARKFVVNASFELLLNDTKWRHDFQVNIKRKQPLHLVLPCEPKDMYELLPTWVQGQDKQGRPVIYRQYGNFVLPKVLKLLTMEQLLSYHVWTVEMAVRKMHELSQSTGYNIETFTVVVDAGGWTMKYANADAYTFIRQMSTIDSDHYPERLGTLIIINAHTSISFAYNTLVRPWIDDVTKQKIQIYSSRKHWEPALLHLIDKDKIPHQYGGTAPNLSAEEALASMNPPPLPPSESDIKLSNIPTTTTTTTTSSDDSSSSIIASTTTSKDDYTDSTDTRIKEKSQDTVKSDMCSSSTIHCVSHSDNNMVTNSNMDIQTIHQAKRSTHTIETTASTISSSDSLHDLDGPVR